MGADIVIAVDISSPLLTEEQLTSIISVTEQLTNFLTRRTTELQIESLGSEDILIVPELGDFSSADFEQAEDIVHLGYEAAVQAQNELMAMAHGGDRKPVRPPGRSAADFIVQFVDIDNGSAWANQLTCKRSMKVSTKYTVSMFSNR